MKNLRAEMARNSLTIKDLALFLGVRYATVCDKMNGRSKFYFDEAYKIRNHFFSDCDICYLFEEEEKSTA